MIASIILGLVTIVGILMFSMGIYIKRKMMLADSISILPARPHQEQARNFIDELEKIAGGNNKVYQITQTVLVFGFFFWVIGGSGFVIYFSRLR